MIKQAGNNAGLSRNAWQVLSRAMVLLLLLTHQSWAGSVCLCSPQVTSQSAGCQATQHSISTSKPEEHSESFSSSHCAKEEDGAVASLSEQETAITDSRSSQPTEQVVSCCRAPALHEAEAAYVSSPNQAPAINILPSIYLSNQTNQAPAAFTIHHRHHTRPLYLAFSCLLI